MKFFKIRKFLFLFYFAFVTCIDLFSQNKNVGIGTLVPDQSAILHLEAPDRGLLIPRVILLSVNDVATIQNPVKGLLVYNVNSPLSEGFYYWDGAQWVQAVGPIGPIGPPGIQGVQGPTGADGITGPTGPTNVDSLIVTYASFDTLFATIATFDSLFATYANFDSIFSSYIYTDTIVAMYAVFDSVFITSAYIDSIFSNYIFTDTIVANFASFDSIYASYANFDSLFINGTSIDSFVSNMIDTTVWKLKGNSGTNPATDFLGTADTVDLAIRTNNVEHVRITSAGNVGIGMVSPSEKLEVLGDVKISGLSASGIVLVESDNTGKVQKKNYSGNSTDVLTGDGNWTPSTSVGIPTGGIIMWSGTIANIPAGWALCDGTNGTPDLTDKFILSVSSVSEDPGATGGAHSYSLTTAQLPSHNHAVSGTTTSDGAFTPSGTISTAANHTHTGTTTTIADHSHTMNHGHGITDPTHRHSMTFYDCGSGGNVPTYDNDNGCTTTQYTNYSATGVTVNNFSGNTGSAGSHNHTFTTSSDGSHNHSFAGNSIAGHNHTFSVTSGNEGTGNAIDNRSAFFKLAFIMKL